MRWLVALLLTACTPMPAPEPQPLPDGPGGCADARANLERLGGCGANLEDWTRRCLEARDAEAELGVELPTGCIAAAETCEQAWRCR